MFDVIVTVCLLAQPGVCGDRIMPVQSETRALCDEVRTTHPNEWASGFEGLSVAGSRCVESSGLAAGRAAFMVMEVAQGVFVHTGRHETPTPGNRGDIANLGFVVGRNAVAVVDAGGSRAVGEDLYAAIRARTDLPIRWLILTHMHPDHVLGAGVFKEAGATVVGHAKLAAALANRAEGYTVAMQRLLGNAAFLGTRVVIPDVPPPPPIDLGGRTLTVEAHPLAHTDNDVTVYDDLSDTLFAGDLIFVDHAPAIDGSILGWQAVLSALADTPAARVVPGHGPASIPWPDGVGALRRYLATLTRETREAIARGERMSTAVGHLGESMREEWLLFDEYNPRNATAAFKELEWE